MKSYNNFCAITESSNLTFPMTRLAVSSFIANNLWFDGTLIILILKTDPLSSSNIDILKSIYSNVEILEIDHSDPIILNMLHKFKKKGIQSSSILNYLNIFAFNIESQGNIYFSRNTMFMGDVSAILDDNHMVSPTNSNSFPILKDFPDSTVNSKLMFVPKYLIDPRNYSILLEDLKNLNVSEPDSDNRLINDLIKKNNINTRILSNLVLCKSSNFIDQRYTNFVRYSKSIKAIYYNTHEIRKNYSRIHTYWIQQNEAVQSKLNSVKRNDKIVSLKIQEAKNSIKSKADSQPKPGIKRVNLTASEMFDNFIVNNEIYDDTYIRTLNSRLDSDLIKSNLNISTMDLFFFKSFIANKNIAIVANSSELLNNNLGEAIDSHDIVIRFNSYKLIDKHTGSKTTIHASVYLQNENLDKFVPIRFILSNNSKKWVDKVKSINKYKHSLLLKYNHHSNLSDSFKEPSPSTTGFSTLILLLKLGGYNKINLFGFNFYDGGYKSILRTDVGMQSPISKVHNYAFEKKFILSNLSRHDEKNNIITFL
jgi:hypothetical protein